MTIISCIISVIICEIITYELSKYCSFESFTFKEKVKALMYKVTDDMFGYQI